MIHPLADVQSSDIGEKTTIWQFAIVLSGARIGCNCNINCHTFIDNKVRIGNNVTIKAGVYVWEGIDMEDNVFIGPNVTFINDTYPRSKVYHDGFTTLKIRKGASIGAASVIRGGIEIGEYAMVGAGALVTRDIPPFTLWYGSPAVQKGFVTRSGKVLNMDLADIRENKQYRLEGHEPVPVSSDNK